MTSTYSFEYSYKGRTKTKKIVANSLNSAMENGELFLEDLDDRLELLGSESWEEVQDECNAYNIIVGDLEEEFD